MKRIKIVVSSWLVLLTFLLLSPILVSATDINVFPTGSIFKITPALTWGVSTPPGFNNNYFFTPININESVCVFVYNNNPTNPHTFTASISVTGDPASTGPSTGTWQTAANSAGLFSAISPGLPAGIGASVTGAAQVSVNFSASSTQAGNPDTANVTIIQTSGNCFSGNQFVGSAPQTVASVTPLQAISDGLSQSFSGNFSVSNPTIGQVLINLNPNSGIRSMYLDRLVVVSTVASTININVTTTTGTGCSVVAAFTANQKFGSSVTSSGVFNQGCATPPVVTGFIFQTFPLAANVPFVLDLRGIILPSGQVNGFDVSMAATLAGNIVATVFWYEK